MTKQGKLEFVQFDDVFRDNRWKHQIIEVWEAIESKCVGYHIFMYMYFKKKNSDINFYYTKKSAYHLRSNLF